MAVNPWYVARLERAARILFLLSLTLAVGGFIASRAGWGWWVAVFGQRGVQPWGALLLTAATLGARDGLTRQHRHRWAVPLLSLVALVSLAIVVLYNLGELHRLDWRLRLADPSSSDPFSGLPGPNLSLVIFLTAAGVIVMLSRFRRLHPVGEGTVTLAGTIALMALVGLLYGDLRAAAFPFGLVRSSPASVAAAFLLVGAVLTSRPTQGLLKPLVSDGVGGILLRRLVPLVLLVPPVMVGLLVVRARFNAPGVMAVIAVSFMTAILAGLLAIARDLDRYHANEQLARDRADRASTALTQAAPVMVDLERVLSLQEVEQVASLEVAARYAASAGMAAGDSLAVFPIGTKGLGVVMVDAVGHGAQPALQALRLRDSLVQAIRLGFPPGEAIASITWMITGPDDMATVAVAVADGSTGEVRVALGGHPPPLLGHNGKVDQLEAGGPLLHSDVEGTWTDHVVILDPGSRLILFTDGVADVFPRTGGGDDFSELAQLLTSTGPLSAAATADACLAYSERSEGRRDDRAVVVLVRSTGFGEEP